MSDLSGKKGLILGVGNQRSIAWAMAEQLQQQGAELGLTFLSDPKGRFEANVRKLGDQVGATFIHECDVSIDESIQQMADALKAKDAQSVSAYITHPVLSGDAIEKINQSSLDQLVVTDTIPLSEEAKSCKKIRCISLAPTLAEAIKRLNKEESISEMLM